MESDNIPEEVLKEVLSSPEMLKVLKHMHKAKVDYAKNTTRYTDIPQTRVTEHLLRLRSLGLLDTYGNTSIKRTAAKLKKSAEVHKHHTYFQINRRGDMVLKKATPENYLKFVGPEAVKILCFKIKNGESPESVAILKRYGLLDSEENMTDLGSDVLGYAKRTHRVSC
ncbi:MAG: DUF2250 domain-containing protein [Thermoplasmataceae archaeon]